MNRTDRTARIALVLTTVILLAQVAGWMWPESWWGTHYLAFLPLGPGTILLLLAFGLAALPAIMPSSVTRLTTWSRRFYPSQKSVAWLNGVVAVATGLAFYYLRIADDNYGNATYLQQFLDERVDTLPGDLWQNLFGLKIYAGQGRGAVLELARLVAYLGDETIREAYAWIGATSGAIFIGVWLGHIRRTVPLRAGRWLMGAVVLSLPVLLVFMGHTESYSVVFMLVSVWLIGWMRFMVSGNKLLFGALALLLLICLRFHSLSLLLLFPYMLGGIGKIQPDGKLSELLGTPGKSLMYIGLPLVVLGLAAYFTVLQDYASPRTLVELPDSERLLLPVATTEPLVDRYDLFSGNHFFDLLQMGLFAAPTLLFILGVIFLSELRQNIRWRPDLVLLLLTTGIFAGVLFFVNPLFSLPMDFDLYCFPILPLLGLAIGLAGQISHPATRRLFFPVVGLCLLWVPVATVNVHREAHAHRLESLSVHMFRTYYKHSDRNMLYALNMPGVDATTYLERQADLLEKIRPYVNPGYDPKYQLLLVDRALTLDRAVGDRQAARETLAEAARHGTLPNAYVLTYLEWEFEAGNYAQAHEQATQLVHRNFPSRPKALSIALHTALEAKLYDRAHQAAEAYLMMQPEDTFIQEIEVRLREEDRIDELSNYFEKK